jgi:hypothetical protein
MINSKSSLPSGGKLGYFWQNLAAGFEFQDAGFPELNHIVVVIAIANTTPWPRPKLGD